MRRKIADETLFDDVPKSNGRCHTCGAKERILVRLTITEDGKEVPTHTEMGVCINQNCWRHTDIGRIPTWMPRESIVR